MILSAHKFNGKEINSEIQTIFKQLLLPSASEAAHYSWRLQSTRPILPRDLYIVEISICVVKIS